MSRILRRPMFRGGRVDSRGTGITSGLSYQKGGRVGYKDAGAVTGGDIMARLSNFFNSPALNPDGTPVTLPRRNIVDDAAFLLGPGKFLKTGGAGLNMLRQAGKYALKNDDPFTVGKEVVEQVPFLSNQYFKQVAKPYLSGMKETLSGAGGKIKDYAGLGGGIGIGALLTDGYGLGKAYDAFMSKDEDPDLEKIKEDEFEQQQREALEKILADQLNDKKEKVKDSIGDKESIKESTKEYAEILGGDKATGKDVTDMLLSFAGKALKPEADVKSAFGEFFEAESKRPSRRDKIDQAAATLAINEYIAGKKSKADLDRFFMEMDFKKDLSKRQGDEFFATNLAEVSKSKTGYAAIDLTTRMTHPKYGSPIKLDVSEGDTVESLPIATDNFKKVFIEDEAPYRVVAIDFDQTTGKLYKKSIY